MNTRAEQDEQRAYLALVEQARSLGLPTSLDDPRSPRTVQGLRDAVEACVWGETCAKDDAVACPDEVDVYRAQCELDVRSGMPELLGFAVGYLRGSAVTRA